MANARQKYHVALDTQHQTERRMEEERHRAQAAAEEKALQKRAEATGLTDMKVGNLMPKFDLSLLVQVAINLKCILGGSAHALTSHTRPEVVPGERRYYWCQGRSGGDSSFPE